MVDLITLSMSILNHLFENVFEKTTHNIDKAIEILNTDEEKYLPVLFRDKTILAHSKSKRYRNGTLVNKFIDVTSLEPEQEQQLLRLQYLKKFQESLFHKAVTAVIECSLGIIQQDLEEDTQQKVFLLLFDECLWKDKDFIKSVANYIEDDEVNSWYPTHSKVFQSSSSEYQTILDKIDKESDNRKIIKEFTDVYYGIDFLDNF